MQAELVESSKPVSPRDPARSSPRVLILRAGAIGDTLMVTPLVRALRRTFPAAYLVFLCSRQAQDVLRHNPHLDEVIPLGYRHLPAWLSFEKLRARRHLRKLNLDWALVLESHRDFTDLARSAGRAQLIGYGNLRIGERCFRAAFDPRRHSIENHLTAGQSLGVQPAGADMELYYPGTLDKTVGVRLARLGVREGERVVGVHPGWGGRKHPPRDTRLRSWPADRFADVVRWLVNSARARVVLTGGREDRALTALVASLSGVSCLNLAGELSLLELAALVRRLDLYVTVDSGPAHMAAALGTPLVVLWGPGIFEQTAPLAGRGPVRILYHRVPCAPCYGTPLMKSCRDNICMKQIEVREVCSSIEQLLPPPGPPG